jgi:hypothetical protein
LEIESKDYEMKWLTFYRDAFRYYDESREYYNKFWVGGDIIHTYKKNKMQCLHHCENSNFYCQLFNSDPFITHIRHTIINSNEMKEFFHSKDNPYRLEMLYDHSMNEIFKR